MARVEIGDARHSVTFGDALAPREDSFRIPRAASPIVVRIVTESLFASPDGRALGVGLGAFRVRAP